MWSALEKGFFIRRMLHREEGGKMEHRFEPDEEHAHELDEKDQLSQFRERFYIPDGTIYMDGNSLGLLSKDAEKSILRILSEWKTLEIRGWLEAEPPWFHHA